MGVSVVESTSEFAAEAHVIRAHPGSMVLGVEDVDLQPLETVERGGERKDDSVVNGLPPGLLRDGVSRHARVTMVVVAILCAMLFATGAVLFVMGIVGMLSRETDDLTRAVENMLGFGSTVWGITLMVLAFLVHTLYWYLSKITIATSQSRALVEWAIGNR
ncbi:MAG: hypothetical protein AAGH64_09645 [Planctomycetota bacterium]